MKTNRLKKLSAICLVLLISGAAWACGSRGGSCGDKETKETAVFMAQCSAEKNEDCDKKDQDRRGCKGAGAERKGCTDKK